MSDYIVWFVGAALLVAVELFAGSLYLLMAALGAAGAGVVALAGGPVWGQFFAAGLIAISGFAWLRMRGQSAIGGAQASNLSFDVGQQVEVIERRTDGTLRVAYRGSQWDAQLHAEAVAGAGPVADAAAVNAAAGEGPYFIREVRGTRLILGARKN